jgi:hypothetical protein
MNQNARASGAAPEAAEIFAGPPGSACRNPALGPHRSRFSKKLSIYIK